MDKLNKPDILMLLLATILILFQLAIMSNKLPHLTILGGEEEEEFPEFSKRTAMLDCDIVINNDIDRGGSTYWDNKIVFIGMSHGLASSITACEREAMRRQ